MLSKFLRRFTRPKQNIIVQDVKQSKIKIVQWFVQPRFKVREEWLNKLLLRTYDDEIKSKYIPELHQDHDFERRELKSILKFRESVAEGINDIENCIMALKRFREFYARFYQMLREERINVKKADHLLIVAPNDLAVAATGMIDQLNRLKRILQLKGYIMLVEKDNISQIAHPLEHQLTRVGRWEEALDNLPDNIRRLSGGFISSYNQVFDYLRYLNRWIEEFQQDSSCKIIAGKAGMGKTHTSGHIIKELQKDKDYVIFFKAKQFSGDDVNFEERLLDLMQLPHGLRLNQVLEKLNRFARSKGRRLFIIIDALNETSTTSLGFSDIWHKNLPGFIATVSQYSHLYFISTLRTSYIDSIWPVAPKAIAELKGFSNGKDIRGACEKYFYYYKIVVTNDAADYSYFDVPLLLDLFCKMVNDARVSERSITLGINSYISVFEKYVADLVDEVKRKRDLAMAKPVIDGLNLAADRFIANIEGFIDVDAFVSAFDPDPRTKEAESIARPVLEGYLLFIKDKITPVREIVKHTQQEVGGYLLATRLNELYPTTADLLASAVFQEKLIGINPSLHHQLRLDILKFLIASRPEIITSVVDDDALMLSWWFLYNGYDGTNPDVPAYLLEHTGSKQGINYILGVSRKKWFDPANEHNFLYISSLLTQLSTWEFDLIWGYFVYNSAIEHFGFIEMRIAELKKPEVKVEDEIIIARLLAFITATTVRELRDLATIYLVEFGKRFPLQLLELADFTAGLSDIYIYERVVSSLYGVVLIRQHDQEFILGVLPEVAERLFRLQFAKGARNPVFNYIVIDSIKHLLDLAMLNGVWTAPSEDKINIAAYISPALPEWVPPSDEQLLLIENSSETDWPEPIGMDFGIYTIPRLIDHKEYELRRPAIANVYKRIYELGFLNEGQFEITDEKVNDFYFGNSVFQKNGKVDRLGKKYSWKGFFDYAGVLLQRGELDIYVSDNNPASGYERLGDVDIDISIPNPDHITAIRIYPANLMAHRSINEEWYMEDKIDTIYPHLVQVFDGVPYVMLKGGVEQRIDEEYKVRSFVIAETCFISKNEQYERLKNEVCYRTFNWDRDLHLSASTYTRCYFGEFYWADNQVEVDDYSYWIKTGQQLTVKRTLTHTDVIRNIGIYSYDDVGKEVEKMVDEGLSFDGEATLIQYLWESESKRLEGFGAYIPTVKIGKVLGLKTDPTSGKILDANLQECLITIEHEEGQFKNEFTYLRADLAKVYMDKFNLGLLYQLKQHSYDLDSNHNRIMKYVVIDDI